MTIRLGIALFSSLLFQNPLGWDGQVTQWGTMKEVLVEGKSESRFSLDKLHNVEELAGVGALEGLVGEITIYGGKVWITKDEVKATQAGTEHATLLTTARVAEWSSTIRQEGIAADQLESVVREAAMQAGLDTGKPFPFVIEGRLTVEAHVIRGKCPHAAGSGVLQPPIALSIKDEPGVLVGFYAENSEGKLTHHGSKIHAHVLTRDNPPRMGHVDSAAVASESIIRVPARKP